jgi:hypothetical protein
MRILKYLLPLLFFAGCAGLFDTAANTPGKKRWYDPTTWNSTTPVLLVDSVYDR